MTDNLSESNKRIGATIRDLRQTIGLSQEALAAKIGLPTHQTISDIEAGRRAIKAAELPRICAALRTNLHDLLAGIRKLEPVVLWRNEPDGAVRETAEANLISRARNYAIVEGILGVKALTDRPQLSVDLNNDTNRDLYAKGEQVAAQLGLGSIPATSLRKSMEEQLDIKVFFINEDGFPSGATTYSDEFGFAILINAREVPWRNNFSIAHELFHVLTWNSLNPETLQHDSALKSRVEKFADAFAAGLLLPSNLLNQAFNQRVHDGLIKWNDLISLARLFEVSTQALLYRLSSLGRMKFERIQELIASPTFQAADRKTMSEHWKTSPSEVNERFLRLLVQAFHSRKLSKERMADLLNVDLADLGRTTEAHGFTLEESIQETDYDEVALT